MTEENKKVEEKKVEEGSQGEEVIEAHIDCLSSILLLELSVESFKEINKTGEGEARTIDGQRVLIKVLK